jgi:WD40 repeat protein
MSQLPSSTLIETKSASPRIRRHLFLAALAVLLTGTAVWGYFLYWEQQGWEATLRGHAGDELIYCVAFSPDSSLLASGSGDRTVRLWDVATRKERSLLRHPDTVKSVAFSPDGKLLATAGEDGNVRVWEVATSKERFVFTEHAQPQGRVQPFAVHAVAFSPDGKTLASAGEDVTVRLFDLVTGKQRVVLKNSKFYSFWSVAFTPDGNVLVGSDQDGRITLWEPGNGKQIRVFRGREVLGGSRSLIAMAPDGKTLLCGHWEKTLYLWDLAAGKESLKIDVSDLQNVNSVAYSPNGKFVAAAALHKSIVGFWDAQSGQLLRTLRLNSGAIAFSPDGRFFAAASHNGHITIWNATKLVPPGK